MIIHDSSIFYKISRQYAELLLETFIECNNYIQLKKLFSNVFVFYLYHVIL